MFEAGDIRDGAAYLRWPAVPPKRQAPWPVSG